MSASSEPNAEAPMSLFEFNDEGGKLCRDLVVDPPSLSEVARRFCCAALREVLEASEVAVVTDGWLYRLQGTSRQGRRSARTSAAAIVS
jgi:hypothetical protein